MVEKVPSGLAEWGTVLTFSSQPRPNPVRLRSLISALLILALSASASACLNGTGTSLVAACRIPHTKLSHQNASRTANDNCGQAFKGRPDVCRLRGLLPFHFLTLPAFEIAIPFDLIAEKVAAPSDSTAKLTSVGSPETDRGPPRSR